MGARGKGPDASEIGHNGLLALRGYFRLHRAGRWRKREPPRWALTRFAPWRPARLSVRAIRSKAGRAAERRSSPAVKRPAGWFAFTAFHTGDRLCSRSSRRTRIGRRAAMVRNAGASQLAGVLAQL